ncbi:uncharacterized protein LOC131690438 [Topomyia yanbarensis]|uniref:uncharacterized protein LOC131690438 n=1 Tax=Topomyia yanbarensis TaxID=2498891 RepID=UPI00273ABD64|nr:uncharacterized protein LOC131690438 [Topomyia yanbarensis]XP_058832191.1 uncharacterized protein LOC131690438 [Topomyia yanbarensis]
MVRTRSFAKVLPRPQILLLLLLQIVTESPKVDAIGDLPVSNIPIYSDGIYFEKLKPVKIQISTWTLQADYELKEFVDEITLANASVDKLIQACRELKSKFSGSCESIGNIVDLTRELNDFKSLLESFCKGNGRQKRGILRSWFGLMDDDDRDEIDGNFKKIDEQIDTQTSTVEHFFNSTNEAIAALSGNMFKLDPKKPGTIDYTREGQLLIMDILLNKILRKKELFMKLLQSSSTMSLSDDIVSPNRLLKELEKLQKILPAGFTFPVSLDLRGVIKMYPLSKVVALVDDCKMKVNILLPLCETIEYTTLKGTSVPTMEAGILKMFPLENDVLVYNDGRNLGMVMNYAEYKSCNHLNDIALCNTHHLIKNLSSAEDCIVATFFNRTNFDSDCRVSRLQLRHQIWIQLADPNRWVYAVPNRTMIEVNYGLTTKRFVEIGGVGMLKLIRMCHVRSQDVILQYVPQLGGTVEPHTFGFQLPAVVTRDQSRIISASDNNKVILAGKNTESAVLERTHVAGIHYEQPAFSPWAIVGIVCGVFIVTFITVKVYLKMVNEKQRQQLLMARLQQQELGGQDGADLNNSFQSTGSPNTSQQAFLQATAPSHALVT